MAPSVRVSNGEYVNVPIEYQVSAGFLSVECTDDVWFLRIWSYYFVGYVL